MIYYVNINAARDGNGSETMPYRHINDAAQAAVACDEIIVAPEYNVNQVGGNIFPLSHHRTCRSAYGDSTQFQSMSFKVIIQGEL